jgi:hypothetical protein
LFVAPGVSDWCYFPENVYDVDRHTEGRLYELRHLKHPDKVFRRAIDRCKQDPPIVAAEWFLNPKDIRFEVSLFTKILQEYMPDPVIPYNIKARQQKFSYAYEKFADRIAKWRSWK